ncbi:MAG: molybdopterin molybdotransferase MoeA [Armatimonadota bacterium]|nr:molybdopterin molybdotransferase MoeA [Armatimonadota bacterium]
MAVPTRAFGALLTPAQARARYLAALDVPAPTTETLPVHAALGRVLAVDVVADVDLPPFDRSAVDGWAVRAADVASATPGRPVRLRHVGEVVMGAVEAPRVEAGAAVRVPTGGVLPAGADAVVMQEDVAFRPPEVWVRRAVQSGANVVARGVDVRAGEVVLARGRRLRPADLGILAGLGYATVPVATRPHVAIVATGDEVVPPEAPLRPGLVRDMNSAALAGAVEAAGGQAHLVGIVRDDRALLEATLREAVGRHAMVLVSGGSSVGERDTVADAIGALGPPGIVVHGVAIRPGKPTILAAVGRVPVLGLPGNPVSALVTFDLFARPVLERLLGADPAARPWDRVRARLADALPTAGAREDHRRVRLEARPDGIWAHPLPAGSQVLTSLARADGIVVVPPDGAGYAVGDEVEVRLV